MNDEMEGCRRKMPWTTFKVLSQHLDMGTEENNENPKPG
jgi:hypothetical protein